MWVCVWGPLGLQDKVWVYMYRLGHVCLNTSIVVMPGSVQWFPTFVGLLFSHNGFFKELPRPRGVLSIAQDAQSSPAQAGLLVRDTWLGLGSTSHKPPAVGTSAIKWFATPDPRQGPDHATCPGPGTGSRVQSFHFGLTLAGTVCPRIAFGKHAALALSLIPKVVQLLGTLAASYRVLS
jgi:hypothetical protein